MTAASLFYEECRKRGFLEQYDKEIEYRFTELYYVNTLLSYMQGMRHPRIGFVKELRAGQLKHFPQFEENVYYQLNTGEEEKQWIALLGRSAVRFYWYYRLKFLVRRVKKALRERKAQV